ncbi:MAG: hypothetical protein ABIS86_07220 [Streptosporangiaceae bacterium]
MPIVVIDSGLGLLATSAALAVAGLTVELVLSINPSGVPSSNRESRSSGCARRQPAVSAGAVVAGAAVAIWATPVTAASVCRDRTRFTRTEEIRAALGRPVRLFTPDHYRAGRMPAKLRG